MTDFYWPGDEPVATLEPAPTEHREVRVIGPPGCGKTTYLSHQAKHVAAPKYGASNIVICSLTRAAAHEIGGRDTTIPPENVGTLHAHAFRALDRPKMAETKESLVVWNDECPNSTWRIDPSTGAGFNPENAPIEAPDMYFDSDGAKLLQHLGLLRQKCVDPALWPGDVRAFHAAWLTFKSQHEMLDFTDLISWAVDSCDVHPAHPKVIMADEAQDMSELEMRLLRKWGAKTDTLVVVGDPDQALYTWRGAHPDVVFGNDPDGVLVREQGYRVPENVRSWAQQWIEQMPDRLPISYLPRHQDPRDPSTPIAQGSVDAIAGDYRNPNALVKHAITTSDQGQTIMLLASCSYMLTAIIKQLREAGVPFHNPYRGTNGMWNPLAHSRRLSSFLNPAWTWADVKRWTAPMVARGFMTNGSRQFIDIKAGEEKGRSSANEIITDVEVIRGLFRTDDDALAAINRDTAWWEEHLKHQDASRQAYPLAIMRKYGASALTDTPNITIGTIHSVKGGEADQVIMLPDLSNQGYWNGWSAGGEPRNSVLRQFYVAATRAREQLWLAQPSRHEAVDFTMIA